MTGLLAAAAPLSRDAAREAARRELSRQEYADAQPPLLLRLVGRALRAVSDLLDRAAGAVADGALARVVLALLVVGAVAVVLVRLGPLSAGRRGAAPVFPDGPQLSAADHRARAEQAAAQGRWAEAVRERLRALVRELAAQGLLDARPGRTALELAREAGAAAPALAADLRRAAAVFDEVSYGGRPGSAAAYAVVADVDARAAAGVRVAA